LRACLARRRRGSSRRDPPRATVVDPSPYDRLLNAEERLEAERERRGISEAEYDAAQIVDPQTGEEEAEDLARLARSVAALGGRLEVNAVFPDITVRLLIEPET
jgi:hypothetical protein